MDRLAQPADGAEEVQFENRFSDGRGGHFWAEVILSPLELDRDRFVQALIRDVTNRKNYERELEQVRAAPGGSDLREFPADSSVRCVLLHLARVEASIRELERERVRVLPMVRDVLAGP